MSWEVPDDPRIDAADDDPEYVQCEHCKGEGYLEDPPEDAKDDTCPKCLGSGRVPNEDLLPCFPYCRPYPL